MKHYGTAKEILEESIKDITAGQWCKGKLAIYGEGVDGDGSAADFNSEDLTSQPNI